VIKPEPKGRVLNPALV